jgi:hypothetical protein
VYEEAKCVFDETAPFRFYDGLWTGSELQDLNDEIKTTIRGVCVRGARYEDVVGVRGERSEVERGDEVSDE